MPLIPVSPLAVRSLAADERGATVGEYVMLIGFVVLVVSGAVRAFGSEVSQKYNEQSAFAVNTELAGDATGAPSGGGGPGAKAIAYTAPLTNQGLIAASDYPTIAADANQIAQANPSSPSGIAPSASSSPVSSSSAAMSTSKAASSGIQVSGVGAIPPGVVPAGSGDEASWEASVASTIVNWLGPDIAQDMVAPALTSVSNASYAAGDWAAGVADGFAAGIDSAQQGVDAYLATDAGRMTQYLTLQAVTLGNADLILNANTQQAIANGMLSIMSQEDAVSVASAISNTGYEQGQLRNALPTAINAVGYIAGPLGAPVSLVGSSVDAMLNHREMSESDRLWAVGGMALDVASFGANSKVKAVNTVAQGANYAQLGLGAYDTGNTAYGLYVNWDELSLADKLGAGFTVAQGAWDVGSNIHDLAHTGADHGTDPTQHMPAADGESSDTHFVLTEPGADDGLALALVADGDDHDAAPGIAVANASTDGDSSTPSTAEALPEAPPPNHVEVDPTPVDITTMSTQERRQHFLTELERVRADLVAVHGQELVDAATNALGRGGERYGFEMNDSEFVGPDGQKFKKNISIEERVGGIIEAIKDARAHDVGNIGRFAAQDHFATANNGVNTLSVSSNAHNEGYPIDPSAQVWTPDANWAFVNELGRRYHEENMGLVLVQNPDAANGLPDPKSITFNEIRQLADEWGLVPTGSEAQWIRPLHPAGK